MYIFKGPYLKHKDFCPDPVPKYGIPDYANSIRNPKVWGTKGWQDWWEEQFDRCINGYWTGGMFITGRYYKFLNFDLVSTVGKGNHNPGFIDFQYDFFNLVDHVKEIFKGIIALKARRKGLSEMVCSIMDTGYRFKDAYHAGICAGLSDHVDDFMLKFRRTINLKPDEMKISALVDNNDMIVAGYRQKDSNGKQVEKGSLNTVFYGTMNKNPNIFKGKYLDDCVFEEGGEFELLERGYQASKPCFMDGDMMVGTPYAYGCVCAGTKVWNNDGNLINIEDLIPENGILGFNGVGISKEEIIYWQPPTEKECFRITTNKGTILECSEDHPILYSKKGLNRGKGDKRKKVSIFIETRNLKVGNQVALAEFVPVFGTIKLWQPRFIGWLIGDGSYGFDKTPVLSNCDEDILNFVESTFNCRLEKQRQTKDGRTYKEIRIKGICPDLRKIGIYGQTGLNKTLPIDAHLFNREDICELLGGLFDTDGHVNCFGKRSQVITLTASSRAFLFEVKLLMQKLGIHCNISRIKVSTVSSPKSKNDYYRISISDIFSVVRFVENIRFSVKYKQEKLELIISEIKDLIPRVSSKGGVNGIRFERVKEIISIGKKSVYNLTAGTTNTYIANGIITHNTGGNMNKGSKAFSEMWSEAASLNLEKFFVKASKMYFPCVSYYVNAKGVLMEDVPNLKAKYKDHERIGMEDEAQAEKRLMEERAILKKKKNKKAYHDHLQNYPLTEKESFLKFSGNNFNSEVLNEQLFQLNSKPRGYGLFELEYVKDAKGKVKFPLEVEAIPIDADNTDLDDKNYVMIHHKGHPLPQYKDLDVAGIDSYDMDQSNTSKSLGAMVVYRRSNDFTGILSRIPVLLINFRPNRKEIFYEMCLKAAVYYKLLHNVLIDAEKGLIIEYFIANGGSQFLAQRPLEFDSPNSEQMHKWGAKFTTYSKPRILGVLQADVLDCAHNWEFPMLINDVIDYDVSQKTSDWDSADAYMLARMRDIDMSSTNRPKDTTTKDAVDPWQMPVWAEDSSGNIVNIGSGAGIPDDDIKDQFLRLMKAGYYG